MSVDEDSAAALLPLWSRPISISQPDDDVMYVLIPVLGESNTGTTSKPSQEEEPSSQETTTSLGVSGVAMALLRLSVHQRGPGGMHIVLESVNGDPPYLLENRTPFSLQYRQAHVKNAPFHLLEAYSAAGYAWEYSIAAAPEKLEVCEQAGAGAAVTYALHAGDAGSVTTRAKPLPLSVYPNKCSARVAYFETVVASMTGIATITGDAGSTGVLGRGGVDRVLQLAPGIEPLLALGLKGAAPAMNDVRAVFELPGLEISVVDEVREELMFNIKVLRYTNTVYHVIKINKPALFFIFPPRSTLKRFCSLHWVASKHTFHGEKPL